jgi:uncharacterized protein YjiS (DUF1127 family)
MISLFTSTANAALHILAAAVTALQVSPRAASQRLRRKTCRPELDQDTLKDIGVEPGAITWI